MEETNNQNQNNVKKFPEGFIWGASTASYQVEGGIENNDWAEAAREGKVPIAGRGTDQYHLYEKDFDLAKSMGHTGHRFSLEWSRIEPEEGKFSIEAFHHYRAVLTALRERSIRPFVTIWHFTLPIWFVKKGGFLNPEAPEIFARYAKKVTEELGNESLYWMTINEPLVYSSNGYMRGTWPPFAKNPFKFWRVVNNLIRAHILAYREMKAVYSRLQIGVAKNNMDFKSNWNPINVLLSKVSKQIWNNKFLNGIKNDVDFIGINYYFQKIFGLTYKGEKTDMGWPISPDGLKQVLLEANKYGKPIYVTENGLADTTDKLRTDFLKKHLEAVWGAIQEGANIKGYLYWSLIDNYEWAHGFGPRFGLIEVNYETLERIPRLSAEFYSDIIRRNGII